MAQSDVVRTQQEDYRMVTVVEGLEVPWSMAWLPNGDMLVTERPGRLRIVRDGQLVPEPITGTPTVRARGQGGLLEVAVHPDFESNQFVYLTYSKPNADGSEGTTALMRARLEGGSLVDAEEIYEASAWSTTNGHYGSRLAFDGQGHLFMTVGDRQHPPQESQETHPAQDLADAQGSMLRLNEDGTIPSDNPFVNTPGAAPEIWSRGHRSPQGFAIHPETGDVWETEHGPQGGDELNRILGGANYGWPVIGYGVNYGPGIPLHQSQQMEGMEQPVHFWVPSIATSGLMIYVGDRFPEWSGDFFAGGLGGEQIARLEMDGQTVVAEETILSGFRVRDIRQGPDGLIYVANETDGTIIRLEPAM
jgi:glucose/arabinose dehydrogenase